MGLPLFRVRPNKLYFGVKRERFLAQVRSDVEVCAGGRVIVAGHLQRRDTSDDTLVTVSDANENHGLLPPAGYSLQAPRY